MKLRRPQADSSTSALWINEALGIQVERRLARGGPELIVAECGETQQESYILFAPLACSISSSLGEEQDPSGMRINSLIVN